MLNKNPHRRKYPKVVRQFCLTLHYLSPRAYRFIRATFSNRLPAIRTIQEWYRLSTANAKSGISQASLNILKQRATELKAKGKQLLCSLSFDEMAIKQHVQWDDASKEFVGFVTYAKLKDNNDVEPPNDTLNATETKKDDETPIAKDALVFMINGVNDFIRLPLAYYFVQSTKGIDKSAMIEDIVTTLTNCGVRVSNITFDGHSSNISTCKWLGAICGTTPSDIIPYFLNPVNKSERIYIIFDPSHMIKLLRNHLANRKVIYDYKQRAIEWKFIERLFVLKIKKIFTGTNKLSSKHIKINNEMHVGTAVETLSDSVANDLKKLTKDDRFKNDFDGAEATIEFIRNVNKLFDILNSNYEKLMNDNIFKRPIHSENKRVVSDFCSKMVEYISKLKLTPNTSHRIIDSEIQCGFRGSIINIKSVLCMYADFVEKADFQMLSLPTHAFSQDYLELLFGKIRSMGGCNDNPTVVQFQAAYRKLLVNLKVLISDESNVKEMCFKVLESSILTQSSNGNRTHHSEVETIPEPNEFGDQIREKVARWVTDTQNEARNIDISANAYKIENIISRFKFYCDECKNIFAENDKIDTSFSSLAEKPCTSTMEICTICDNFLSANNPKLLDPACNYKLVYNSIFEELKMDNYFAKTSFISESHKEHKYFIVKCIVDEYLKMECKRIANAITLSVQNNKYLHKYKKIKHFSGA